MHARHPGISAISIYVPRHRVDLERWCEWTDATWPKVAAVVGRSFRVCGPEENAYTMAASAVLRLIRDNRVDPRRIGMLALGTESSTDNAAGAVIVRGMVDDALRGLGLPSIARSCEVPEFKHACLGGIYATKAAARYLAADGRDQVAIVVSSDIAEYQRGSSGEQTQGAGAVAFLLEAAPKLLALDLEHAGSASRYRGYDFRKPFARHFMPNYRASGERARDFPVFNGKYSTTCYVDQIIAALDGMFAGLDVERRSFYAELAAAVFHRPYQQLPITALATALTFDIARDRAAPGQLDELALAAGVDPEQVRAQVELHAAASFDLRDAVAAHGPDHDPFAAVTAVAKQLRGSAWFREFQAAKLSLGSELVRDVGNLYTASLPAWLAAAFEDALCRGLELAGKPMLLVGYGSGDAAEAIPATVVPGWQRAAARIGFARALESSHALDRDQYEALHDGRPAAGLANASDAFAVREVGASNEDAFQDIGIEYYEYRGPTSAERTHLA
ncbi:Hydroxymethylglutaryl-CoA synthase [Enhygromyxa salina]|uniref:Hydroxymethylglutaryl-CoA synthase n=1 Tax=Enhygromyxa salina TaxID=215803 RepID=A0A0C2DAA8_9BACT|nr:Hydroxymethylglutaryl-CoA synthase [Enhygromyxa salina]